MGVPDDEAVIAADVLLEADKRGISSHGIGRLKPIYCDRIDAGIMKATAPTTIVHEVLISALNAVVQTGFQGAITLFPLSTTTTTLDDGDGPCGW